MVRSETRWIVDICDVECVFPTLQKAVEAEQEYIRYLAKKKEQQQCMNS